MRGSFPSGHGAAEVAYVFGASQEAPALFLPLGGAAMLAHWSLVRAGKHYVSDMLMGGFLGLGIAMFGDLLLPAPGWRKLFWPAVLRACFPLLARQSLYGKVGHREVAEVVGDQHRPVVRV